MNFVLSLLFALTVFPLSSHGQNYQLMGRGIVNRETNERIALICLDNFCNEVQFVLFTNTSQLHPLGPIFIVPNSIDESLEQKALKLKIEEYLSANPEVKKDRTNAERIRNRASWTIMIIVGGAAIAAGPMTVAAAIGYASPIALSGLLLRAFPPKFLNELLENSGDIMIISKGHDNKGWNWSVDPKPVSQKKFDHIVKYLMVDPSQYVFVHNDESRRMYKKIDQLTQKGVDFNFHLDGLKR